MAENTDEIQEKLAQATQAILASKHLVVLVGAGLSVESGIPPYRRPGGLGTKYGEPAMLSYREFVRDPKLWWETRLRDEVDPSNPVYEMKRAVDQANPNPGHFSLVELERLGLLKCTITQNVDNLHRRAGSESLLEVHGNRTWLRCTYCGHRWPRQGIPLPDLPPRCPDCLGVVKMDTVMFGEPIPPDVLKACWEQAKKCDCMLLIGTSGTVNPAARLPILACERGATLVEINPQETDLTPWCQITLTGPSGELLPLIVDRVRRVGASS